MRILLVCSWLLLVTPENEIYDIALLVVTGFVILIKKVFASFHLSCHCIDIALSLSDLLRALRQQPQEDVLVIVPGSTEAMMPRLAYETYSSTWYVVELCPQIHKIMHTGGCGK
jgi:hypothetical protein